MRGRGVRTPRAPRSRRAERFQKTTWPSARAAARAIDDVVRAADASIAEGAELGHDLRPVRRLEVGDEDVDALGGLEAATVSGGRLALPFSGDTPPSAAELQIAKAQLVAAVPQIFHPGKKTCVHRNLG